ncbi:hypothetical protein BKP35_01115 [Anaerobacillus arseniciselenatis]|uniref:Pyrrolo-quinoline quinone repeat domain-containing protein n=1 Tax=Anaerobacillus arseniciselenatis TaxID=85682 RepID=A0A1S2LTZ8_9BACI|nr:PQQ-binding-like beta-propeller repeat protein [Anaerobacillus arseniciselenatis]OIJ15623.1 hypothetical protein BKP35_01115 [Anaerobacillus arseniciselenatis]
MDVSIIERKQVANDASDVEFLKISPSFQRLVEVEENDLSLVSGDLFENDEIVDRYLADEKQSFPEVYTEMEGVLTFRGNHLRDGPSFGAIPIADNYQLNSQWSFSTGFSQRWGGGAGWTGQPSIIKWDQQVRGMMNLKDEFKVKDDFVEVIYGSLDGRVYFLDLNSGEKTREPIYIGNPVKGSVSIDPRGYPLLYVGDGVPQNAKFGHRIFSLIDQSKLYFLNGNDPFAYRNWGAFDSSPLINRLTDTLVVGGENGLFYKLKLNTEFNVEEAKINVTPKPIKYRYQVQGNFYQGIENSVAAYANLAYFADNGGSIQGIDLMTMEPFFALPPLDDTDSTIVIEVVDEHPYLYTGTEVDNIGRDGNAHIRKIDGLTGEIIWHKEYTAFYYPGVVGGVLATPVLGKKSIDDLVIFTVARYKQRYAGLMVALNKQTGEEVWRWEMPHYAWSSPVDVYDEDGKAFLVQGDSIGNLHLLEARSGTIIDTVNLGANIEATPAVYENMIIVGTRGGKFYGVEIQGFDD